MEPDFKRLNNKGLKVAHIIINYQVNNSINDRILYYMQQTVVHGMTKNEISATKKLVNENKIIYF